MSIQSIRSENLHDSLAQNPVSTSGKYSSRIPSIGNKIRALALPIFLLTIASNIPGVDAGFAFFAVCMAGCLGATAGALAPACAAACTASLAAPTP